MKYLFYILAILLISACGNNNKNDESKLTEEEAYDLINEHFVKAISNENSIILFNERQLTPPSYKRTFEQGQIVAKIYYPVPHFTTSYWKKEEIKGVTIINWENYNSYFERIDTMSTEERWTDDFGNNMVHNVSYPIYNGETKLAVIKDHIY